MTISPHSVVSLFATHSSCHMCLLVTCVFLHLNLFVIWAFLSFGGFLSLVSFCHLGLVVTWVFLPFGSSCYLDLLVILVFLTFGSFCHLGLLATWVFLPLGSSCHFNLLVIWVLVRGSLCHLHFLLPSFCLGFCQLVFSSLWSSCNLFFQKLQPAI